MPKKPKQNKLQKWLDKTYKKEKEKNINIQDKQSNGSLKIEGFTLLENISLKNSKLISLKIINCPQLIKIDLLKLTSDLLISRCHKLTEVKFSDCHIENLLVGDCPELTKLDCSHSQLTNLDLSNHNLLKNLNCSGNNLTELDVSNLTELDCSNNKIKSLNLNLCPEIIKLNCSNNLLTGLEIRNCLKLSYLDCSNNILTSLNISKCPELLKNISGNINVKSNPRLVIIEKGEEVKNLLIVGRTGGGKSTLSNVLSGTAEFNESGASISITKNFQNKIFTHNGINYRVVDTMGVGDTNLSKKKVLYKIAEGIYSMPEGISHVLFVVDGRFTADEIETFFTFEKAIFESGIVKYITIVRTKFSNFKNKDECEKDKKNLRGESKTIEKIVDACKDIFYVDNPVINIINPDEEDLVSIKINKKIRRTSRVRLLDYSEEECQNECLRKCHPEKCLKELKEHRRNELDKCLKELQEKLKKEPKELQEQLHKEFKELRGHLLKKLQALQGRLLNELKELQERLKNELKELQERLKNEQKGLQEQMLGERKEIREKSLGKQRELKEKLLNELKELEELQEELKELHKESKELQEQLQKELKELQEQLQKEPIELQEQLLKGLKELRGIQEQLQTELKELQDPLQKKPEKLREQLEKELRELREIKEDSKQEKLLEEPKPKTLKKELEKHQEGCLTCQRRCHKCHNKCYYKLKKWDQLRDEIAIYMKDMELEGENLEAIIDKIAELTERRLNKEIPALFRAFRKVSEDCSII